MNLEQLRYFVATADVGTMTAAAQSLHVSQPALTRGVRSLERELGIVLFVRAGRGVELTGDGHQALITARRILRDVDSLTTTANRSLRICATVTQMRELCVAAASSLARRHPDLVLSLDSVETAAEVVTSVESGEAILGVCDLPVDSTLTTTILGVQELALVCPPEWDLPDSVPLEAIHQMDLLASTPGTRRRRDMDEGFKEMGVAPTITLALDQWDLAIPMVVQGVGATLAWPDFAREAARQGARVVTLEPGYRRTVAVLQRPGAGSAQASQVIEVLQEQARVVLTPT